VEQLLIRNLPDGTKARLHLRATSQRRTVEAEARAILADALASRPASLVDLLSDDASADIDFVPVRMRLSPREADL